MAPQDEDYMDSISPKKGNSPQTETTTPNKPLTADDIKDIKLEKLDEARKDNRQLVKRMLRYFAVVFGVILMLVIVSTVRSSLTRTMVSEQWHRVIVASYEVEDALSQSETNETSLDNLRKSLVLLERESADAEFQSSIANSLLHNGGPRDSLSELARQVADYSRKCEVGLSAVRGGSVEPGIFSELSTQQLNLSNDYQLFQDNLKRPDPLPIEVLNCSQFLQNLDNRYQTELKETEEQQRAKEEQSKAQAEAEAAEKSAVQIAVETFIDGQVEGDPTKVESVMTTGYAREYDFDALRGTRYEAYKAAYYRVNDITKAQDGDYEVVASVTYTSTYTDTNGEVQTYDQTQQVKLEVVLGPGEERWLINREIS